MRLKFVVISINLLIIFSIHIVASGITGDSGQDPTPTTSSDMEDISNDIETSLQNGGSYTGTAPSGTPARFPDGSEGTVSGPVSTSHGELSAESLDYNGASMSSVSGFSVAPGGFRVDSVASFFNAGFSIINGKGLSFINGILSVDSYDSFTGLDSISTDWINFSS